MKKKAGSRARLLPPGEAIFAEKKKKPLPFEFVFDAIAPVVTEIKPMFGCHALYVEDKIMLILRDKREPSTDNGVWLATTPEHHASLARELPSMRSIQVFGSGVTGWQVLPADSPDFEEAALRAAELVLAGDPRIGKVPASRRSPSARPRKSKAASR